jgi:hypothetical protein
MGLDGASGELERGRYTALRRQQRWPDPSVIIIGLVVTSTKRPGYGVRAKLQKAVKNPWLTRRRRRFVVVRELLWPRHASARMARAAPESTMLIARNCETRDRKLVYWLFIPCAD